MNTEKTVDFSIIIPVYNTPPADLKRCVGKILGNEHASWEVIFVDDGSCEETLQCLKKISGKVPQVRVFYQAHGGAAAARNFGTQQAAGRYVTYVDSDDYTTFEITKKSNSEIVLTLCGFPSDRFNKIGRKFLLIKKQ